MDSALDRTTTRRSSVFQVGATSLVGTALEFYDLQIYGTAAALVFPKLFFPSSSTLVGELLAFGTLAIGSAPRPVGAVIFGHLGDRIGRKNTLIVTLLIMGVVTFGLGLLPTYQSVGMMAPVLLVALRVVQGVAYGGEFGGASLIAYEHAPPGRRCLYASLPNTGLPLGVVLGNAIWLWAATLPTNELLAWGWRVPFLASFVLVAFGVYVRFKIGETPEFQREVKDRGREAKLPLADVLRHHWRQLLLVGGSFLGFGLFAVISITYLISYATVQVHVSRSVILSVILITTVTQLFVMPIGGWLADRYGALRIVMISAIGSAVTVFAQCLAVSTGQFGLMLAGYLVCFGVFVSICYGALTALFAAAFSVETRYSGSGVGYNLATLLGAAIGPLVATALFAATGTILSVAGYACAGLVLSAACLLVLGRRVAHLVQAPTAAGSTSEPAVPPGSVSPAPGS